MPTPDADAALHALQRENERLRRAVSELSTLNELATAIGAVDVRGPSRHRAPLQAGLTNVDCVVRTA